MVLWFYDFITSEMTKKQPNYSFLEYKQRKNGISYCEIDKYELFWLFLHIAKSLI